jgi:DNA segregation ATPase FtsK/SpoIIIE-like protein
MLFDLVGKATIEAIAIKRGRSDDAVVSASLRLRWDGQQAAPVAAALGAERVEDVAMFHEDEVDDPDRNARFIRMGAVPIGTTYAGKHTLQIADFSVRAQKVSRIAAMPVGLGLWVVSASILIDNPPSSMLEVLAEMLHAEVRTALRMDAELQLEGGGRVEPAAATDADADELLLQAIEHVQSTGRATISGVQRALRIGYNRAARLVESMEMHGIVTTPDKAGARRVIAATTTTEN